MACYGPQAPHVLTAGRVWSGSGPGAYRPPLLLISRWYHLITALHTVVHSAATATRGACMHAGAARAARSRVSKVTTGAFIRDRHRAGGAGPVTDWPSSPHACRRSALQPAPHNPPRPLHGACSCFTATRPLSRALPALPRGTLHGLQPAKHVGVVAIRDISSRPASPQQQQCRTAMSFSKDCIRILGTTRTQPNQRRLRQIVQARR